MVQLGNVDDFRTVPVVPEICGKISFRSDCLHPTINIKSNLTIIYIETSVIRHSIKSIIVMINEVFDSDDKPDQMIAISG